MANSNKMIEILKVTILGGALVAGSYLVGRHKGFNEGVIEGKQTLVSCLVNERYDICQEAKFARSLKEQDEILAYSAAIERTFELLNYRGHLDDISETLKKEAILDYKKGQSMAKLEKKRASN